MLSAVAVLAFLDLNGYVAIRGINATGPQSWLDGGWGRMESGGDRDDAIGVAQIGVDWTPSRFLTVHASGAARHDPAGDNAGVVEAYVDAHIARGLDELHIRAGQFFLPTSRENKDALWASPYSLNFSALNSWIAEEVRPVGVDLSYRHVTGGGHSVTAAATAFRGNDTMGALLAWRGWSVGNRISTFGEVLPLPPLDTLDSFFSGQKNGTQPFGRDLDGRTGYASRVRYAVPQRAMVQYLYLDNRGDKLLHRGEYAWHTRYHQISAEAGDSDRVVVAAEYMKGRTAMGPAEVSVDAAFQAGYLLISAARDRNRFTARFDVFSTRERDFSPAETNEESGRSWTLTWMYDLTTSLRLATEFTQVTGARVDAPDPDGHTFAIEARYRF